MNFEIKSGTIQTAKKTVIYGPEGIGKSTFAAQFPDPVFIDTEGSTVSMDVRRLPTPSSWTMLNEEIKYIADNPTICRTLVVDTADWAEKLAIRSVLAAHHKKGIEDFGYGNGYRYAYEEFGTMLNNLQIVIDRGVNVNLTAHAFLKKFEQPDEMGAYDRWALKLIDAPKCSSSAMLKEWADILLFANYKTYVVATDDKGKHNKAQGGKRVMYAQHHPCWDAKNRYGLPSEMPFEYKEIAHLFASTELPKTTTDTTTEAPVPEAPPIPEAPPAEPQKEQKQELDPVFYALKELMDIDGITPEQVRRAVADKGYYPYETKISQYDPQFVDGCLIGAWDKVKKMIKGE